MNIYRTLENDVRLKIIVQNHAEERMEKTCFRGSNLALAGNFINWRSSFDVFAAPTVLEKFIKGSCNNGNDMEEDTFSCTIELQDFVGWESTAEESRFESSNLELFELNSHSTALRVTAKSGQFKAPKTKLVTFVYSMIRDRNYWTIFISSIYPGEDIGELDGDVTTREGRVFFSWTHPGE